MGLVPVPLSSRAGFGKCLIPLMFPPAPSHFWLFKQEVKSSTGFMLAF